MKFFRKYFFSTEQRVSRKVYWVNIIFIILTPVVGGFLSAAIGLTFFSDIGVVNEVNSNEPSGISAFMGPISGILVGLCALLFLVSTININVRRWHDLNKSWLWIFVHAIPIVGNLYGIYCLGFQRGTVGPNRYGDDPLEPSTSSSKDNFEETTRDIEETSEIKSSEKEELASSEEAVSDNEKDSPEDKLTKLSELKEKGLIDEEDYNSKKEEILKTI